MLGGISNELGPIWAVSFGTPNFLPSPELDPAVVRWAHWTEHDETPVRRPKSRAAQCYRRFQVEC